MKVLSALILGLTFGPLVASGAEPLKEKEPSLGADHAAKMAKGLELFKSQIRGVLDRHCLKCHGGEKTESEFDLAERKGLLKGGLLGPAIVPGNARGSLLYKVIAHEEEPYMPHNAARLPEVTIRQFAAWIDLGAAYDGSLLKSEGAAPAWTTKVIDDEARRHWAFRPLARVEPPIVKDTSWRRTPIDPFILARMEQAGITPNPAVSKRQLVRRAYFDLLGLPPSPEEIQRFLADESSDAYGQLLDRLLASPQYGERWARHWLDLVRFAESHGFEHDYDRPTAYHYRDFVIQAFNDGLPFDTFVKWQIAGDEFAPQNNEALKATGFLAAGVHSTQITKNEVEKHRYDEMDDMLSTISTSMLGLTIGCARCHDHKYDAIPQSDYYRLLSTFTTTVRSELDLDLDPEGYRHAKAAFEKEHAPLAAALAKFEREELPARFTAWASEWPKHRDEYRWLVTVPTSSKSQGGATIQPQDDGSLLVSGKNAKFDTYTFTVETHLAEISALRLEALPDASLTKNGPGRASNGNFALSSIEVQAAPSSKAFGATPVALGKARATFEQNGLPVAAVIDSDAKSAWAVDPQFGKPHAAVFEFVEPIRHEGGALLTITLKFNNNTGHNIGRPRLSLATGTPPEALLEHAMPQEVAATLDLPADKRSAEQTAVAVKWYRTLDARWRELNQAVQTHLAAAPKQKLAKALISSEGLQAVRLHTQGADFLKETHFLRRGDTEQKDGVASPGFLQALMNSPRREQQWFMPPPAGARTSFRRAALANWLTDTEYGAGNLLARVIVNRLWQYHMGRGIVATPSDFGTRGDPPTHPELLDWLAGELIRNGWQLKPIQKLILQSAVYQQDSQVDEAKVRVDRDNRLLWRRPMHRLEAEVIRDSLLAIGGELDLTQFGPGTLDQSSHRRSIYFTVKRSKLMPMMQVFDAPDALQGIGERSTTTIAPQALLLLNNPQVREYAKAFARRIAPNDEVCLDDVVKQGYVMALAREPDEQELADSSMFIAQQMASYQASHKSDARLLATADFCQTLMCLNEFVYID